MAKGYEGWLPAKGYEEWLSFNSAFLVSCQKNEVKPLY